MLDSFTINVFLQCQRCGSHAGKAHFKRVVSQNNDCE